MMLTLLSNYTVVVQNILVPVLWLYFIKTKIVNLLKIKLHYIALRYVTLHHITLHQMPSNDNTLHY